MMETALLQALGIASGGIFVPGSILFVLLFLNTQGGARTSAAYIAGYSGAYMVLGMLSLMIGQQFASPNSQGSSPVSSSIFLALGLVLLFFAFKRWRNPPTADAPPPKFLSKVDAFTPKKAFLFGMMVTVLNLKNLAIYLSAISVMTTIPLTPAEEVFSVFLIVFVFCSSLLSPLVIYFIFHQQAEMLLLKMRQTLETHNYRISQVMLLLFGSIFFFKGGWGLLT